MLCKERCSSRHRAWQEACAWLRGGLHQANWLARTHLVAITFSPASTGQPPCWEEGSGVASSPSWYMSPAGTKSLLHASRGGLPGACRRCGLCGVATRAPRVRGAQSSGFQVAAQLQEAAVAQAGGHSTACT